MVPHWLQARRCSWNHGLGPCAHTRISISWPVSNGHLPAVAAHSSGQTWQLHGQACSRTTKALGPYGLYLWQLYSISLTITTARMKKWGKAKWETALVPDDTHIRWQSKIHLTEESKQREWVSTSPCPEKPNPGLSNERLEGQDQSSLSICGHTSLCWVGINSKDAWHRGAVWIHHLKTVECFTSFHWLHRDGETSKPRHMLTA